MTNSKDLLAAVARHLDVDAGLVTYEYPGCVVIPNGTTGQYIWFGTANGTWQGDVKSTDDATVLRTIETGIPATTVDASSIALGIARTLLADRTHPTTGTVRVALIPYDRASAVVHPACVPATLDRATVQLHDMTRVELLDEQVLDCVICGERILTDGGTR